MNFRERYEALRIERDDHGEFIGRIDYALDPPEWETIILDDVTRTLLKDLYDWHHKEYKRLGAKTQEIYGEMTRGQQEDGFFLVDDGVNGIYRLTVEELKSDKHRAFLDALIEELRNEKDTKETYE